MEKIEILINNSIFNLIKTDEKMTIETYFEGENFSGNISDKFYDIFQKYKNGTLKDINISFDGALSDPWMLKIDFQITIPGKEDNFGLCLVRNNLRSRRVL